MSKRHLLLIGLFTKKKKKTSILVFGFERLQILFKWFNLDSYYPLPD